MEWKVVVSHTLGMIPKRKQYRRTFVRQWRQHRHLTLEQFAERVNMSASALSYLERGQSAYNQETIEKIAEALTTDPASLLMRDPTDPDAIWSIWEQASEAERQQIVVVAQALKKTGNQR